MSASKTWSWTARLACFFACGWIASLGVLLTRKAEPSWHSEWPEASYSISAAPPVLSQRPADLEVFGGTEYFKPSDAPSSTPSAPSRSPDELVLAVVGRWRADDGTTVEVDPPKDAKGKMPPYRLVVRATGLPRGGFGCEFAVDDEHKRKRSGTITYYAAWCEAGKRATVGIWMDAGLSVVILDGKKTRVRIEHATRVEGDRR